MQIPALAYNVTRDYPYRWYTSVVVLILIIATIFFSIINLVSSGFSPQAQYLSDPNATYRSSDWLSKWPPSLAGNSRLSCQSTPLAVGTNIWTTHGLFEWLNTGVTIQSENGTRDANALIYKASELEDCGLHSIVVEMDVNTEVGVAAVDGTTSTGVQLTGRIWCSTTDVDHGRALVNLTTVWKAPMWNLFRNPLEEDAYPSRWWSRTLLYFSGLWLQDSWSQTYVREWNSSIPLRASMSFGPQTYDDRFSISTGTWAISDRSIVVDNVASSRSRDVFSAGRSWAEVFTSAMWTDLGQPERPNIFSDPDRLEQYAQNISTIVSRLEDQGPISDADRAKQAADIQRIFPNNSTVQDLVESSSTRLAIEPAEFATNYLCQVPVRKPWGNLVISILVADLVFLRALWTIVNFIAMYFAKQQSPTGNSCETCARRAESENAIHQGDGVRGDYTAVPMKGMSSTEKTVDKS